MKTSILSLFALILFSGAALAADVSGTWTGVMKTNEGGAFEVTLTAKADGNGNLTGTYASGSSEPKQIANGKVSGNEISFSIIYENDGKTHPVNYMGTMDGNKLNVTLKGEGGRKDKQFTLTKQ